MELDHIGILVQDLGAAIEMFGAMFGYAQATRPVDNTRQRVRVVFMEKKGSLPLKLFQKLGTDGHPTPTRGGAQLHHLAFRTDEMKQTIEQLEQQGARVLVPPEPGEAFENEPIAFIHVGMGLNSELVTTEKRAERLAPRPVDAKPKQG